MPHPKAFALIGPTASGKTALALHLARRFPCEIISMDSALVYRGMDIGTAKPSVDELATVPHHLINIISPLQSYSAADFVADCIRLANEIHARGRLPVIAGGTMMYFHALVQGLDALPEADAGIRAQLQQDKAAHGLPFLYSRLQQCDAESAARIKPNDSQRIERALEIFLLTGQPMSALTRARQPAPLDVFAFALLPHDRSLLHSRINARFETMLAQGFLDEVQRLRRTYPQLQPEMPSMRCVGYRQAWAHLDGTTDRAEFTAQGQAATRQLAKRQLTWLRKLPADAAYDPFVSGCLEAAAEAAAKHFGV